MPDSLFGAPAAQNRKAFFISVHVFKPLHLTMYVSALERMETKHWL